MSDAAPTANEVLVRRAFELFGARDAGGLVELMDPAGAAWLWTVNDGLITRMQAHPANKG